MADRRETALDIAVAVNAATNLDEIVQIVLRRVGDLMPYDRSSIALLDPDSSTLELREITLSDRTDRDTTSDDERGKRVPVDESNVLGWAVMNRKPHLQSNTQHGEQFQAQQEGQQVVSHIIAPLIARRRVLGLLNIGSHAPQAFDSEDVALFCHYARLTAVAIENMRNYEQAQELSIRDGLTGAHNRRHFREVIEREMDRVRRYDSVFSLFLLDVDDFKSFNDTFGHRAGDWILAQTVRILGDNLRVSDQVFRDGGEEFAVVLPGTSAERAGVVAEKAVAALRRHNVYRADRRTEHPVTASVGVASAPEDARSVEGLVACADQALYRAKASGRDRAVVFSAIDGVRRVEDRFRKKTLTQDDLPDLLRRALGDSGSRETHNQPLVELAEMFAEKLGLDAERRMNLKIAACYHDIGEVGIPSDLIARPGPLDARELSLVRRHPVVGETLLSRNLRIGEILQAVLYHHERYDGGGMPKGLRGEEIPYLARALAVIEVFDALRSQRPYRDSYPVREAYRILRDAAGFQLDPELVQNFIAAHSSRGRRPPARRVVQHS
jgi:diguanylate cyclase (GGDEF)-like protein